MNEYVSHAVKLDAYHLQLLAQLMFLVSDSCYMQTVVVAAAGTCSDIKVNHTKRHCSKFPNIAHKVQHNSITSIRENNYGNEVSFVYTDIRHTSS
jgi:hypothetical protein